VSGLLAVKLRRDLRANRSRFALMVIALTISLTAFGGMLCAWSSIGRETSGAYMSTEPASATIVLERGIDAERMAAITAEARRRPGVIEAAGRTQFESDVKVDGRPRPIRMQVFVAEPDDPMRIAKFDAGREGRRPPPPGRIFVRNDSLTLLGLSLGDVVTIRAPGGGPVRLQVAGTVYDPSLAPSAQEQRGRGYLSTASLAGSGQPVRLDQLKIQVADRGRKTPSRDREAIVAVAAEVGEWLRQEHGLSVREIQVPKPYAHPHQWQADALLLSLLAGATAALLLSAILVANMLNGLFAQQIPQIGIMKAVGARSGRIGRLYLTMTLLVAAAATLLALGPSALIGRSGLKEFVRMLGVEPASLAAPWWAYAVTLLVGLELPPLMALAPLVKTSRITVRAAIDHHGGSETSAATNVLARLSRTSRIDRGLLMALRNTVRRPGRFLLSVGLLAGAGMVFVAGMSLSSGVDAIQQEQKQQRNWDVDVQLAEPVPMGRIERALERVRQLRRAEGFRIAQVGVAGPGRIPVTRTYPDQGHGRISLLAVPGGGSTLRTPKLLAGRWLEPAETGAVVLNQLTRDSAVPDVDVGDRVQLIVGGQSAIWRVVGLAEEREGGGGGVYTTAEGLAAALGQPQRVNRLRIVTEGHDERTRKAVASAVDEALAAGGIEVESAASISHAEAVSEGHLGPIILILVAVAIPLGVVGVIGLASTMSTNVLDRTREFGVMHAIGARPKVVRRIVTIEGVFLALASCLVAIVPALALTAVLGVGLGNLFFSAPLPYRVSVAGAVIWLAVVVLGAILATDSAASRAARLTVREALAYL